MILYRILSPRCVISRAAHLSTLGVSATILCPFCAREWARITVADRDWRAFTYPCPECPPWPLDDSIPGSLFGVIGSNDIGNLPPELIRRELEVHINAVERS